MPHELALWGVTISPLLPACFAGFALAAVTGWLLARLNWLRFFANPPWVVAGLGVIYVCLIFRGIIA